MRRCLKNGMLKNDGSSFGYYALTFDFDIATDAEKREAFNCMKTATELGADEKFDEKIFGRTLGNMYRKAIGTEENFVEAFHCYEKSSGAGSSTATNLFGVMYHKGIYVEKN